MARAISLLSVMGVGGWAYQSQIYAFVPTQLHLDADGLGWLLALNGLGAFMAALFVANQGAQIVKISTLFTGSYLFGVFIILFGFMRNPIGAAFFLFFVGFGIILFFSIGNSIIQTHSPDHLRGRLMGIWALVFGGGMPIGSFWMGLVASHTSSGFALQTGGLFCIVGAVTVYFLFKKRV
jgi:predicted MFS family arabinose efflux permease